MKIRLASVTPSGEWISALPANALQQRLHVQTSSGARGGLCRAPGDRRRTARSGCPARDGELGCNQGQEWTLPKIEVRT